MSAQYARMRFSLRTSASKAHPRVARCTSLLVMLLVGAWMACAPLAVQAQTQAPLLQATDLQYLGAFRVPDGTFGGSTFEYGGTAPAYNAANNSLFLVGHPYQSMVAELSIPTPVNSSSLGALPTAKVLQPFSDASHGVMYTVGSSTTYVGGLLVYQNRLVGTSYLYYDGTGAQSLSHFYNTNPASFASGTAQGMYKVGTVGAGFVDGYMGLIPPEWQAALGGPVLTGQCCIPIISRSSYGPAVFAFDPASLGVTVPTPAKPLVYYPQSNPLADYAATSTLFNGATAITGVVFPSGTRSVLFLGRQGQGPFCYGPARATRASRARPPTVGSIPTATTRPTTPRGPTPIRTPTRSGATMQTTSLPWRQARRPRTPSNRTQRGRLNLPFASGADTVGGTAWDPATRRLYLMAKYGDDILPLVHVYQINTGATSGCGPGMPGIIYGALGTKGAPPCARGSKVSASPSFSPPSPPWRGRQSPSAGLPCPGTAGPPGAGRIGGDRRATAGRRGRDHLRNHDRDSARDVFALQHPGPQQRRAGRGHPRRHGCV